MPPPGGVIVEFRDEVTKDLVWKGAMHYIPSENDVLEWTDPVDVVRNYEIKGVVHRFNSPNPAGSHSGHLSCTDAKHTPVVWVREI